MLKINIKELMLKNDLSITEISKMTDISRTTINNLVNGQNEPKALQLETLYQLSSLFGVPIDNLFKPYKVGYELDYNFKKIDIIEYNEKQNYFNFIVPITVKYNGKVMLDYFIDVDLDIITKEKKVLIALQPASFIKLKVNRVLNNTESDNLFNENLKQKAYFILNKTDISELHKMSNLVISNFNFITDLSNFDFEYILTSNRLDMDDFI